MNLCRTCKYWAKREHMIGAGVCTNIEVSCRVVLNYVPIMYTAQDFGCILYEYGEKIPSIYPPSEEARILNEFKTWLNS